MSYYKHIRWARSDLERAASMLASAHKHLEFALATVDCPDKSKITDLPDLVKEMHVDADHAKKRVETYIGEI